MSTKRPHPAHFGERGHLCQSGRHGHMDLKHLLDGRRPVQQEAQAATADIDRDAGPLGRRQAPRLARRAQFVLHGPHEREAVQVVLRGVPPGSEVSFRNLRQPMDGGIGFTPSPEIARYPLTPLPPLPLCLRPGTPAVSHASIRNRAEKAIPIK